MRGPGGLSLPPSFSLSSLYFYSLKLECEKLATEKTEIQRHYVMVSELHLKGEGLWGGVSSELSKNKQPWDALASPCVWVVWPGLEILLLWLLCLVFHWNEPWCLSRACCHSSWWRSRSRAGCLLSRGQRVGAPGGPCPFCGLWPRAGQTSPPGRGAGDCVLLLAWPQHGCPWPG